MLGSVHIPCTNHFTIEGTYATHRMVNMDLGGAQSSSNRAKVLLVFGGGGGS